MIAYPAGELTEMVGQYVSEKTGMELAPGMYQAFMIVSDDKDFVGGVVFTNFRKTDIEVSCASESAAAWRDRVPHAIFKYIFDQLGCVRCTSITVKGNKKARAFLEALGFQLEGNIRLGYHGDRDALIYGLLRSECRYLADERVPDGQERHEHPAASAGPSSDSGGPSHNEHDGGGDTSEPEPYQSGDAAGKPFVFADGNEL